MKKIARELSVFLIGSLLLPLQGVGGAVHAQEQIRIWKGDTNVRFTTSELRFEKEGRAIIVGDSVYAPAEVDSIKVVPGDDGTGTLTIGVAPGKWFKADHFRLTFIGAIDDSQEPDIVETVTTRPRQVPKGIYTIHGQRVTRITQPGVYIIDGKKKVVR